MKEFFKKLFKKRPKTARKKHVLNRTQRIIHWSVVGALLAVFALNILILPLTGGCKRTERITEYHGDNQYITVSREGGLLLSAHRAGGELAPEETKAAFRLCMEATTYQVDVLEFDLHLTKDNQLVLLHDHELARTSNGEELFFKGVKVCDLTLAELKTVNFGYNFEDPVTHTYIYRKDMTAEELQQKEISIFSLEEILSYVEYEAAVGRKMNYIIEIKDSGERGETSMDILYQTMQKYNILDRTVVGTFHGDVTRYIDKQYAGKVRRSAGIMEMVNFYYAFLWGRKVNAEKLGFSVLQIPMGPSGYFDFSTEAFIAYAHSMGMAVQFWTINDEEDIKLLADHGADCIMTDNPEMAYAALGRK